MDDENLTALLFVFAVMFAFVIGIGILITAKEPDTWRLIVGVVFLAIAVAGWTFAVAVSGHNEL